MENLKNKKKAFIIILFSILMLIYGLITKSSPAAGYDNVPLKFYEINLFGLSINYQSFVLIFIITLGIGIYFFVFKSDESLKQDLKKITSNKKNKATNSDNKNLEIKNTPKESNENLNSNNKSYIYFILFFSLIFTLYIACIGRGTIWFFIILSYLLYIFLKPKSKKELILKSIGFPLIFLCIISFFLSREIYYGYNFSYILGKNIAPYLICVLIVFFSKFRKLNTPANFSFKNPLLWISIICLLISIVNFTASEYLKMIMK